MDLFYFERLSKRSNENENFSENGGQKSFFDNLAIFDILVKFCSPKIRLKRSVLRN